MLFGKAFEQSVGDTLIDAFVARATRSPRRGSVAVGEGTARSKSSTRCPTGSASCRCALPAGHDGTGGRRGVGPAGRISRSLRDRPLVLGIYGTVCAPDRPLRDRRSRRDLSAAAGRSRATQRRERAAQHGAQRSQTLIAARIADRRPAPGISRRCRPARCGVRAVGWRIDRWRRWGGGAAAAGGRAARLAPLPAADSSRSRHLGQVGLLDATDLVAFEVHDEVRAIAVPCRARAGACRCSPSAAGRTGRPPSACRAGSAPGCGSCPTVTWSTSVGLEQVALLDVRPVDAAGRTEQHARGPGSGRRAARRYSVMRWLHAVWSYRAGPDIMAADHTATAPRRGTRPRGRNHRGTFATASRRPEDHRAAPEDPRDPGRQPACGT